MLVGMSEARAERENTSLSEAEGGDVLNLTSGAPSFAPQLTRFATHVDAISNALNGARSQLRGELVLGKRGPCMIVEATENHKPSKTILHFKQNS
ncbi:hypothetical protein VKT23_018611 [Stygiomarasmius scandens]|uniref:Uncharacterized protein n=1 Tax=Marasmiellus scandens TaxID=2682957 RepID=A0ABR1INR3_9AGAR